MAKTWQDLGGGQWKLTITDDSGKVKPKIVYGTREEITDKLADSAINGDRRVEELKGTRPRLNDGQRMQVVADLNNPGKVEDAILTVVEAAVGSVEDLNRDRAEEREERRTRTAVDAATLFASNTPDWYPSDHNKRTLTEYMKRLGLGPTNVANYTRAFEELKAANLLQAPSHAEQNDEGENRETQPSANGAERTAPAPAAQPRVPARLSTGFRSSDVSGTQPKPTNRLKYTREQIERMSATKYKELMMSDPELGKAVEFYEQQNRQQRRAS